VHGVAVVLARNEAAAREKVLHRLVHAAMAVRELVGVGTRRASKDLVAEADAEYGRATAPEQRAHLCDERFEVLRVARPVSDQHAVTLTRQRREISVPRRANNARAPDLQGAH